LEYWLKANNPVLLVIFHPDRDCLYAVHVQGYVETHPEAGRTGVLTFDKTDNRLAPEYGHKLKQIVFKEHGPNRLAGSVTKREKLLSNFLPLIEDIDFLYSLPTACLSKPEVRIALGSLPKPPFIIRENRIWTCSYLPSEDCALRVACDTSAEVAVVPAKQWAEDPSRQPWLVELMNSCLHKHCARLGLVYDRKHRRFYCLPKDGKEWWFSYQSVQQAARRRPAYPSISRASGNVRFWVHQSVRLNLELLGDKWVLKVIPGYVFTRDGERFLTAGEVGRVATGKKARERNLVVLRHLLFWRDFLSDGDGVITIFPGSQKLVVSKDYLECLTDFGIEGDGFDLGAAVAEEDDLDLDGLMDGERGELS
jgi:hypothetical protein